MLEVFWARSQLVIIIVRDDYYFRIRLPALTLLEHFPLIECFPTTFWCVLVRVGEMIQEERATLIPTRIWIPIRILATDVTETSAPTIPWPTVIPMNPYVSGRLQTQVSFTLRGLISINLGSPYALSVTLGPISLISWLRNRTRRRPSSTKLMSYHRRIPRFSVSW